MSSSHDIAGAPSPAGKPQLPPRDAIEIQLCDIWQSVLGVPQVGLDDDFFDLGGDSLRGFHLISEIHRLFGVRLEMTDILTSSTVAAVAERVRAGSTEDSGRSLVRIQNGREDRPVFFLHAQSGSMARHVALARALGPQQMVWGLQSAELSPGGRAHRTIEDMSAAYIDEMRAVNSAGPWHVVGYSMGGVLAFEIARRLQRSGEAVGLVALLDVPVPEGAQRQSDQARWEHALRHIATAVVRASIDLDELCSLDRELQVMELLKLGLETGTLPRDWNYDRLRRMVDVRVHNGYAMDAYAPQYYPGTLTLIRTHEPDRHPDGCRGWSRFAESVTVHTIDGDHTGILNASRSSEIAELLRPIISSASPR